MNNWIQLRSGFPYDFDRPECPPLLDLVVSVCRIPRFIGHSNAVYTVGRHLINGANANIVFTKEGLRAWLLHDLHEALVGDMPAPMKKYCPGFQELEQKAQFVVEWKYDNDRHAAYAWEQVKTLDRIILIAEADTLGMSAKFPTREAFLDAWGFDAFEEYARHEIFPEKLPMPEYEEGDVQILLDLLRDVGVE